MELLVQWMTQKWLRRCRWSTMWKVEQLRAIGYRHAVIRIERDMDDVLGALGRSEVPVAKAPSGTLALLSPLYACGCRYVETRGAIVASRALPLGARALSR